MEKFFIGVIAGFAAGMLSLETLGAKSVGQTPAPCNNGGCMLPSMIATPIVLGMATQSIGAAIGGGIGEFGVILFGLSKAL